MMPEACTFTFGWVLVATASVAAMVLHWLWILWAKDCNKQTPRMPKSWPVLGSTLELTANFHRLYDWVTDYATHFPTFELNYMSFRLLFTVDPAVVEHILKTNFHNYVKGPASHEIQYELLGHGIFNSDGENWRIQRKSASLEFSSKILRKYNTPTFRKYALRLASVLQELSKDSILDLQDLFMRMTFDSICELGFGVEIASLSSKLPEVNFAKAFDRSNALCASRYFDPLWKLKKFFSVGSEAKLKDDIGILNDFTYSIIKKRRESLKNKDEHHNSQQTDLLSRFLAMADVNADSCTDQMLRNAVLNFIIAGRDTTAVTLSWFFWLLTKNSSAEAKIEHELKELECSANLRLNDLASFEEKLEKFVALLTYDVLSKLHYLHAAITESLRLYPAVPLDGKTAVGEDVLPDGRKIRKGDVVNYVPYAMGRMTRLWGSDALEYRPERWLDKAGIFQNDSPFKFTAFQAGPRICLGKDSAYLQMKMAAALLLRFFRFEYAGNQKENVEYTLALTLLMKSSASRRYGLPMRVQAKE